MQEGGGASETEETHAERVLIRSTLLGWRKVGEATGDQARRMARKLLK